MAAGVRTAASAECRELRECSRARAHFRRLPGPCVHRAVLHPPRWRIIWSMKYRVLSAVACALIWLLPANAFAWGRDGHAIVAQIAESRLTPKARAGVAALLGKET